MKSNCNCRQILLGLTMLFGLAACGGSSDNTQPPLPLPPVVKSIEGGGIVSRFGGNFSSVTVSGKSFDTTSATLTVTINGQSGTVDQLDIGDVATVQATTSDDGVTSVATSIESNSVVEGPITTGTIDVAMQTFVVLGQTVQIQGGTLFDDGISPRSIDGLNEGDFVEVHGLVDVNSLITATRIERKAAGGEFEVNAIISNLDAVAFTFSINALTVDYSNATLDNFSASGPADGDLVEVKGTTLGPNDELSATRVELKSTSFSGSDGDLAEIEGFVTRFVSQSDFDVAGLPITTDGLTVFDDGVATDLALNVRLEAEGELDASGVLVARRIEFKTGAQLSKNKLEGTADSVDTANSTLIVLGVTVQVDDSTRLEDKSNADIDPFSVADLGAGDFVSIEGFEDPIGSQTVTAVRLERDDFDSEVLLQGFLESVNDPGFEILGVSIQTDGSTIFRDANDAVIPSIDFFNAVTTGSLVKAKGDLNGGVIDAREAELEN